MHAGSVSSKHLEFSYSNGDWFALDLGSSNGTRLNESQVPMMEGWWLLVVRSWHANHMLLPHGSPQQMLLLVLLQLFGCLLGPADQTYKLRDKDKLRLGPDTCIQVHIQQVGALGGWMCLHPLATAVIQRPGCWVAIRRFCLWPALWSQGSALLLRPHLHALLHVRLFVLARAGG